MILLRVMKMNAINADLLIFNKYFLPNFSLTPN